MLLGLDIGSSSIKASLVDLDTGTCVASATSPAYELAIHSPQAGFAEQDPESWWNHCIQAIQQIKKSIGSLDSVSAIGISYQMHGLVLFDENMHVLRPAIIWCDSRAVPLGAAAFASLGEAHCLQNYLNSPGNFTASKLAWVKQNEPDLYANVYAIGLPGDFISFQLTGELHTTPQGLSEAILWNYQENSLATDVLDYFEISHDLIPHWLPALSIHGTVNSDASSETGLPVGIPVSFKAGDQPVNAFALGATTPGTVVANAGTSGVLFAVSNQPVPDPASRVNSFLHVNHHALDPRIGVLLCINGSGILNSWARSTFFENKPYDEINLLAAKAPIGCTGLYTLPYGNGAERSLENRAPGASLQGLQLTQHGVEHIARSIQEGIAFSMMYGIECMQSVCSTPNAVRAAKANMFLSPVFRQAFVNTTGVPLELYDTDGSQGAARGAGLGLGLYANDDECFARLEYIERIEPDRDALRRYRSAYLEWKNLLMEQLERGSND